MGTLFGTDGVRGVANTEPMTAETALAIGRAVGHLCRKGEHRHRIVIGKDTRLSGYMFENALTAGICSMGVDVLLVGPLPTPGIAFVTRNMRADAGIVISASHNPYHDNGIKVFSRDGCKLTDDLEQQIEQLVTSGEINSIRSSADQVGRAQRIDDALGRYIVFCKNVFPDDLSLEGTKIVLDCANGATYKAAPIIFTELGAAVTPLHCTPDGTNINQDCGSQFTRDVSDEVVRRGADIGLAFDGDGDRLIAVDETGREITGDHLIVICARFMQASGLLENDLVVVTPMSNIGMRRALDDMGIRHIDAPVGDRNVLSMMLDENATLGGAQSGHIIFRNCHTTGDGIISALHILAVMQRTGRKLSELAAPIRIAPQVLINVDVARKPPLEELPDVGAAVAAAEETLGEAGRVLVRYSGTQGVCRVMVEGPNDTVTREVAERVADTVRRSIG